MSAALSASRAMDVEIDLVRQEIRFFHNASLKREAGAQHSLSPVNAECDAGMVGTKFLLCREVDSIRASLCEIFMNHHWKCAGGKCRLADGLRFVPFARAFWARASTEEQGRTVDSFGVRSPLNPQAVVLPDTCCY